MFFKLYLVALLIFLVIDMVWLGLIAKNFYRQHISHLMKASVNWLAAGIFYPLFIIGLVLFVISPAIKNNSYWQAIVFGALFGMIAYAAYDLTNLATLKGWPVLMTIIDISWGAVLSASVSVITYLVFKTIWG